MTHVLRLITTCALLCPALAAAQQAPPISESSARGWDFERWKLDRLVLRSGKTVEGLIESESPQQIRLLEIRRPQGRGVFGVSRPVARAEIAGVQAISDEERKQTREKFEQYLNRGRVEAVRRDNLELAAFKEGSSSGWRYQSEWFTLESRASEELTRRFVLRLEQIFTAFRRLLPPRVARRSELRIVIYGTLSDYQSLAHSLGATVENAAFYHPQRNLVAAGSDLARLINQMSQVEARHAAEKTRLDKLRLDLPERVEQRRKALETSNLSVASRRKALVDYRRQFEQEIDALERRMQECDRQNEAMLQHHAGKTLSLLYHEAFHAYLENYVYPQSESEVPRWLNEGLAQLFENGMLESGTLRIDVLNKPTLALVAAELATQPAPLTKVLSADHRNFLAPHEGASGSRLHYAYAWSLAYFLTFVEPVLGDTAMDDYVQPEAAQMPPIARFELLVNQPLARFEAQWRAWVLKHAPGT